MTELESWKIREREIKSWYSLEPLNVVLGVYNVPVSHGVGVGSEVIGQLAAKVHLEGDALPLVNHLVVALIFAVAQGVAVGVFTGVGSARGVLVVVGFGGGRGVPVDFMAVVVAGGRAKDHVAAVAAVVVARVDRDRAL